MDQRAWRLEWLPLILREFVAAVSSYGAPSVRKCSRRSVYTRVGVVHNSGTKVRDSAQT